MRTAARWVLGCALGGALWTVPTAAVFIGVFLGGVPLALLFRRLFGDTTWALAWSLMLFALVVAPLSVFVVGGAMVLTEDEVYGFGLAFAFLGAALGAVHALVWNDRWRWWLLGGAVAGPSAVFVVVGWTEQRPYGALSGAIYGLCTCVQASKAMGRLETTGQ